MSDGVFPHAARGLRVGLLGGSFNPAHDGHRLASLTALRRLGLDQIWWLVTPGNPLKDNRALPSLLERIARAAEVANHPRIAVTGIEARLGTRFTAQTLSALKGRYPGVRFVWLMGSDNLAQFHRWQNWRGIARMMPIGVIDRPGSTHKAMRSRAAIALGRWRLDESDGLLLPTEKAPAWMFLHGRRSALSSTALRGRVKTLNLRR
ncbi:MAG: nicotinate-nucleotide adenylyltransferase [Hyphomicrobiales bacterium]|nr:nicotinate-nucleotide adenylyltransferase [Hyphomicrobiales bacterium]